MSVNLMQAHHQWANRPQDQRFQTLMELYAAVNQRRMRSRSADIPLKQIEARPGDNGTILFSHNGKSVEPSHWSFGQLSARVQAPAEYLRRLSPPLAVANLNYGIQNADAAELKFMTVIAENGGINTLQAVTGTGYGRIWDAAVVEACKRFVERTKGKFYNPKAYNPHTGQPEPSGLYASDRDVFIFMIDGGSLLDVGPRAQLNRGFFLWNSETGARSFGWTTFLFNGVCGNHIVWGAQDIRTMRMVHRSGAPERFDTEALPGLLSYVQASAAPEIAAVKKAQDYLLPVTEREELIAWFQARKFTKSEAIGAIDTAIAEEGECRTLWQAVQGTTAFARGFDWVDARTALETKAGRLMDMVKA